MVNAQDRVIPMLALGFRPFFLGAGLTGMGLILIWAFTFAAGSPPQTYYAGLSWHSHEILFGYTYAVIAGFLLTAVSNWTGLPTSRGSSLGGLFALWLLGRLLPFMGVAGTLIAAVDLFFNLMVTVAITMPIIKAKMLRNAAFPILLLLMALANGLVHLELLGYAAATMRLGTYLMLFLVLMMITIIFGRIFPFFTSRVLPNSTLVKRPWLEWSCVASVLIAGVAECFTLSWLGPVYLLASGLHGFRLLGFYPRGMWSLPLIWVLFLGYAWLVIGFLLLGLAPTIGINPFLGLHALTAGSIGLLTLGMMARVSLGHTGRKLIASPSITASFVLLNLGVALRVFGPLLHPGSYLLQIQISGCLWGLAFALYLLKFTPILLRPRPDGKPG